MLRTELHIIPLNTCFLRTKTKKKDLFYKALPIEQSKSESCSKDKENN